MSWQCLGPSWQWIRETGCAFFIQLFGVFFVLSRITTKICQIIYLCISFIDLTTAAICDTLTAFQTHSSDTNQNCSSDFLKKVMISVLRKELNLSFWPWCVLNVEKGLNMRGIFLFWMVLEIFPITFSKLGTHDSNLGISVLPHVETLAVPSPILSLLCQELICVLVIWFLDVLILFHKLSSGSDVMWSALL